MPPTHARVNAAGLIEITDLLTGRVICIQKTYKDILENKWDDLVKIDTPEGPVWLEKGIPADKVRWKRNFPYSKVFCDLICASVAKGTGLIKTCEDLSLEYTLVVRWRREHPEFAEALKEARRDRAEVYHDRALQIAEASTEENAKRARIQIDTNKWAAEKANPAEFGNQTKVVGDSTQPISFVVNTGVRRASDEGYRPEREVTPGVSGSGDQKDEVAF